MNKTQRLVFLLGILIICFMGSCPPWKEAGPKGLPRDYAPIYAPPCLTGPDKDKGLEIDFARLLLQIGVAAVLTGGLITASSTQVREEEKQAGARQPESISAHKPEVLKTVPREEEHAIDNRRLLEAMIMRYLFQESCYAPQHDGERFSQMMAKSKAKT